MQNQERGQDKEVGAAILRRGSEKASFLGGRWERYHVKRKPEMWSSKGVAGVLWSRQGSAPQKTQHRGL